MIRCGDRPGVREKQDTRMLKVEQSEISEGRKIAKLKLGEMLHMDKRLQNQSGKAGPGKKKTRKLVSNVS